VENSKNAGFAGLFLDLRQKLATFRRKIEALGCCWRIAQGMENCKVGQI
jgi:hypothetical protein